MAYCIRLFTYFTVAATTCDNLPPTPWIDLIPHSSRSPRPIPSNPPSNPPSLLRDPTAAPTPASQRTRPPSPGGGGGGGEPTPPTEECVGAIVFCGVQEGDNKPWCGNPGMPQEWGWSNPIGSNELCILGMNMTGCDTEAGEDVGTVEVLVGSNQFQVTMASGYYIKAYHVRY
jgi:hypothetical protein